jgi:outer membrane protein OmpA-like peptidoglycan-associated protein
MAFRSHREDDNDNNAWPGLVDLFAFGMALVLLLWASAESRGAGPRADINLPLPPGISIEQWLAEDVSRRLRARLSENLRIEAVAGPWRAVIRTGVEFPTNGFRLTEPQKRQVQQAASQLLGYLEEDKDSQLVIAGQADPNRYVVEDGIPPDNNVELSALRAASVSALVIDSLGASGTEPGDLRHRVSVRGLGEVLGHTDKSRYGEHRTVVFEIWPGAIRTQR